MIKRLIFILALVLTLPSSVFASNISALPQTDKDLKDCGVAMQHVEARTSDVKSNLANREDVALKVNNVDYGQNDIFACAIKTGDISLWMVPYFIRYVMQLLISISGLVAMGAIIAGGYMYLFTGLTEDKESGKQAIKYGFAGIIVVMLAWYAVEVLILVLTL